MNKQMSEVEELAREAVGQVFASMLSMQVTNEPPTSVVPNGNAQIIGSLGFAGKATGVICINAGVDFARIMTGRMLSIPETEVEDGDMVNDAFGELSNMVVGRVKSRLCDNGWPCTLTIPSIVRGQGLKLEHPANVERSILGFYTSGHHLLVEVLLKQS